MAKNITDRQVKSLIKNGKTGRHAIGNGLYFRISNEGTGFWVVQSLAFSKLLKSSLCSSFVGRIKIQFCHQDASKYAEKMT